MPLVTRYSAAEIPTDYGPMRIVVYRETGDETKEHVAVVRGDPTTAPANGPALLVRVHSECLTSEVLHSLKCDCREQLDGALERIADEGRGVLIYLRQEGRGIGLGNKIRAYALQAEGKDTVDANLELGFAADLRSYEMAAEMLRDLGVAKVRLLTNNPEKISGLIAAGLEVETHVSHWSADTAFNRDYLQTKRAKLGHIAAAPGSERKE